MTRTHIKQAILGLDLGQSQDPTAAALLLNIDQTKSLHNWIDDTHPKTNHWRLASTKVWPLDTPYTQVATHLYNICETIKAQHPTTPLILLADATGIGRPTLEIIYKEFTSHGKPNPARIEGIVFTGGTTVTEAKHPALPVDLFQVPKLDLIQTLLQAIESNQLQPAPGLANRHILEAQLKSLRYANSRLTGQTTVEVAHSTTTPEIANADLVMALAMATWRMKTLHPQSRQEIHQRLPGF